MTESANTRNTDFVASFEIGIHKWRIGCNSGAQQRRNPAGIHAVRNLQAEMVAHDDMDLEFGRIQVKVGGGDGGHNGLRSLKQHLGTPDFVRVRFGVGRPPPM